MKEQKIEMTLSLDADGKAYLDGVFKKNLIPNKCVLNKLLPGTGATTLEIKSHRHSIIIEPNVPVINGKEDYHNKEVLKVIGVTEKVNKYDILNYLQSDITYKKIITTPESYPKVRSAIKDSSFDLYRDFFLLLDECERAIQDSSFRRKIILPFEDFFKYKNKAMVSATPLTPSDPRFKDFKQIDIVPNYTFQKPLTLITTNSLKLSLTKYIETHPDEQYFIFLNSTDVIASIIDELGIRKESNIYCSAESEITLKVNGFTNSYEHLSTFNKYNFFTSRFFSAVDIKLDYKPTVIMLTETRKAFHSILDPKTESIQILGRFRNGIKQAVHVTNIDTAHKPMSEKEAEQYLKGCEHAYNEMTRFYKAATSEGAKATFKEALEHVEYASFLYEDGTKNYFVWDNFINEERVKAYYTSKQNLKRAYRSCSQFDMEFEEDNFAAAEVVLNRLSRKLSRHMICEEVCKGLEDIYISYDKYTPEDIDFVYKRIERSFPEILEAYKSLGFPNIKRLEFNMFEVRKAMFKVKSEEEKGNFQFLDQLKLEFEVGSSYPSQVIIKVLRRIIEALNLDLKPEIKLLREYFDLSNRTTVERNSDKKDIKGFTILKRNFN